MLEVKGLSAGYGDVVAVSDISFSVSAGEVFGLIGANGAGKTTTIMTIAGLVESRAGDVRLDGKAITQLETHNRVDAGIALVPEGRRVFPDLTVGENLLVGGSRLSRSELRSQSERVFESFPRLGERKKQLAGSLSGGEQQMLAMGRAMMSNPRLLLVDELSLGLMPIAIDECYRVVEGLKATGMAIVLVEQGTDRVLAAADKVVVLESGRLTWRGTGEEAVENQSLVDAYLGMG